MANKEQLSPADQKVIKLMKHLTNAEKSALEKKLEQEKKASRFANFIELYQPNYILPFYYTASPYELIYQDNTPDNQKPMRDEFKAQLSLVKPVIYNLFFNDKLTFDVAYTQLMYWQFYAKSQYFRETNYEPEIFITDHLYYNGLWRVGVDHQSNGRGGELERSWNRAILNLQYSGKNWLMGVKIWTLIFKTDSSDLHNPDIAKYLGYENILLAYKISGVSTVLQLQNIESGFKRGFEMLTFSYPIRKHLSVYVQLFNGYGQSLIEYDHKTQSFGVGITLNDWI